jgi:nucleotide-binding universal stress UspA family protein
MATKVVVGVSPSLAGLQALRYAVNLARERAGTVHAVRVWLYKPMWRDTTTTFERRVHKAEAELLIPYAFDAAMGGMPADVAVRPVVVEGLAGHGLLEEAADDEALLVVGGDRRGSHFRGSGPVTRFCVRHAHCPVVVVPPPPLAQTQPVDALLRELGRDLAG